MADKQVKDINWVFSQIEKNDVKFIKVWFSDILGMLKSFTIPVQELKAGFEEGVGFDGSSVEGFTRIDESDMLAWPDPTTFSVLPWRPKENAVARMFADIRNPDGTPFDGDPRYILKKTLERAKKLGYTFYTGPELEYFYFKSVEDPQPLDKAGYFDATPRDEALDIRRDTILALHAMDIPVEYSHHEVAHSQHEIDLRYQDALTMADTVMTHKFVVKEIAFQHGVYATFMPKPVNGQNGSGMHTHMSLFKGDRNAFFEPKDKSHLSDIAKKFIAGIMRHAPEMALITNPTVNSYKRLVPGYEAPVYVTWAMRNRSDMIRVPMYKPGKEKATRIEFRSPDPSCNPYLAFAVMLAAGLEGIEKGYELPAPVEENVYEMSEEEKHERGIKNLPGSLIEAITLAEKSELVRRTLGDHVFTHFIKNKKMEWDNFRTHVTQYEIETYLPVL
ncbi:MAG: glutamine synthetase [Planctomycetes bacterium RBG_16_43_13]|nr:MAG: glutamine synthetase [Planctomycetes bacterium RBG_16_43_13]